MKDQSGNLYVADAILALGILFVAMLMLNSLVSIPNPTYSGVSHDSKTSQDIMEILGGKVDFEDRTFLGEITAILRENRNSQDSIRRVSSICEEKFSEFHLTNYRFVESNHLDSTVLVAGGEYSKAENVSTATRNFDGYSYTLEIW